MLSCPLCLLVDKVYILHLLPAVSHITAHLNDVHPIVSTSLSLSINTALLIHHAPFRIFTFEAICFFLPPFQLFSPTNCWVSFQLFFGSAIFEAPKVLIFMGQFKLSISIPCYIALIRAISL